MANQDTGSGSGGGGDGSTTSTIPDSEWGNWSRFIADDGRSINWGPLVNWFVRGGIYTAFLIMVSWFVNLAGWVQEKADAAAQGFWNALNAIKSGESLIPSAFDEAIAWLFDRGSAPGEVTTLRESLGSGSFGSTFDAAASSLPSGALGFMAALLITLGVIWAMIQIVEVLGVS